MKEGEILKQNHRQKIVICTDNGKKYLKREIEGDKREIYKSLQKISSPNIPKIFSVEFSEKTVVVEEYIEGKSLSSLMEEGHKFSKKEIRSIMLQLTDAVAALHGKNIIHRDIKPDNILVDTSNHIWLIDYDIARIYRAEIRKDTEKMGTFGYAPIEQYGMMPTDFKTDIYAFGATMQTVLDYASIRGCLHKISEKCKRLDPSQRYKNIKALHRAIMLCGITYPAICAAVALLTLVICFCLLNGKQNAAFQNEHPTDNTLYMEEPSVSTATEKNTEAEALSEETPKLTASVNTPEAESEAEEKITLDEDTYFTGFAADSKMEEYSKYPTYNQVAIFSMYKPWDHLLFLEDGNKKGKIKLGKNNTLVNADITLSDGKLKVYLNDNYGHDFTGEFAYNGQYDYSLFNPPDRKNADIICCDMDYDDVPELLIGLNEGCIGVIEHQFYNNFNYCIAWCIKYDEETGFYLCEGDMFSKEYSFYMTAYTKKFNVEWYDPGDITGYALKDNKLVPVY